MSGGGTNTVSSSVPSQFVPYYTQALGLGQNLLESGGPQYYPGQQVAPLNPLQEQGLTSLQNTATAPTASQGAQAANQFETSGALLNPAMNPYLQGTFQQGANQVQNNLDSQFAGSGRNIIGSAPVQSDELNNLATQLYGGAYQQGLQTMTQASALAPSIDAGTYLPSQELLSGGSGLQGQTQNLINANENQWNYNQQLPYNQLSWYSSLLGQNSSPFSQQQQSSSGNPWQTAAGAGLLGSSLYGSGALGAIGGLFGGGAGTAAAGDAALAAGFESDRRLKEDIEPLWTDDNGLTRYRFRYKYKPGWYLGYMADEVQERFPQAVGKNEAGFLTVAYSRIPGGGAAFARE